MRERRDHLTERSRPFLYLKQVDIDGQSSEVTLVTITSVGGGAAKAISAGAGEAVYPMAARRVPEPSVITYDRAARMGGTCERSRAVTMTL